MNKNRIEIFNRMIHGVLLVLLFTTCNNFPKSNPSPQIVNTSFKSTENLNDSIPLLKYTSGIRAIFEDSKGNIWFGSGNEGVCLYDGSTFTYFDEKDGLSHNQVRAIHEDKNGLIWFECGSGLSNFDGKRIKTIIERDYGSINDWKKSDNDLWFKGDKTYGYNESEKQPGVYRYHNEKLSFLVFPVPYHKDWKSMYSVTTKAINGKDGTLWLGTYESAIGYDGKSFKIIGRNEMGLHRSGLHMNIRALYEDTKGNIWLGDNGSGVFMYNRDTVVNITNEFGLHKKENPENSLHRVFAIGEDRIGNIWFGAYLSGLWKYDGTTMTNFDEKDGIPCKNFWVIVENKEGELLVSGEEPSGVYQFNGETFKRKY